MVTYEITATVDSHLIEVYERYMRQHHIPDVLATGCFREAVFTRSAPGRYRVRYEASRDVDLDRYLTAYAPRLREDFTAHFPTGVTLAREVWAAIQVWDAQAQAAR